MIASSTSFHAYCMDCMQAAPGCLQNSVMRCIHARPASHLGPPAAGQDSENALAARRAHGHPRRARARGSRRGHTVACSRARARQQIKISQNLGTPVPKRGKNGWVTCSDERYTRHQSQPYEYHLSLSNLVYRYRACMIDFAGSPDHFLFFLCVAVYSVLLFWIIK